MGNGPLAHSQSSDFGRLEVSPTRRPGLSLDTFRQVAREVAETIGEPVAICRRVCVAGTNGSPFENLPLSQARELNREVVEIVGTTGNADGIQTTNQSLTEQVSTALSQTPGGQNLASYFGIGSGSGAPKQPADEAARAEALIDQLRSPPTSPGGLSALLSAISQHADGSGADPDALRALMRRPKKAAQDPKRDEPGDNGRDVGAREKDPIQ